MRRPAPTLASISLLIVLGASAGACGKPDRERAPPAQPVPVSAPPPTRVPADPHSAAQPNRTAVTHLALELTVDFDRQQLRGTAAYTLDRKVAGADLILDTDGLDIVAARACGPAGRRSRTRWARSTRSSARR